MLTGAGRSLSQLFVLGRGHDLDSSLKVQSLDQVVRSLMETSYLDDMEAKSGIYSQLNEIKNTNRFSMEILRLCSLFANQEIPVSLLYFGGLRELAILVLLYVRTKH